MQSEMITVAASAIGLNAEKALASKKAFISCETAQIRFCYCGQNPTAGFGHLMNPGDVVMLEGKAVQRFKAIRTGSTSGVLMVTYEGM